MTTPAENAAPRSASNTPLGEGTGPTLDVLISNSKRKGSALTLPARKRPTLGKDPYEHRGRHFGRALHAFINVGHLIANGLVIMRDLENGTKSVDTLTGDERREHYIFQAMLKMFPDFNKSLEDGTLTPTDIIAISTSVQRGAAAARSDDVKGIKSAVVEWITDPVTGLVPPIPRNNMSVRGFNHEATGKMLVPAGMDWTRHVPLTSVADAMSHCLVAAICSRVKSRLRDGTLIVKGDQWPIFLYEKQSFDPDDPWKGLLKGRLVFNAFQHVFTSPSSVKPTTTEMDENHGTPRATRAGNAHLHGMTKVTAASLVYVATLVRYSLSNSTCFNRTDAIADSETFYTTLYNFITDVEEKDNLKRLLEWWDKKVFRSHRKTAIAPPETSALARLMEQRKRRLAVSSLAD